MPFREGVTVNQIFALLQRLQRAKTEAQREQPKAALEKVRQPNICLYWKCERSAGPNDPNHVLCDLHHDQLEKGLIGECPQCGQAKETRYKVCAQCYDKRHQRSSKVPEKQRQQRPPMAPVQRRSQVEHSKTWEKGDESADQFFVYILKLDGGKFYAGHTRELRERLAEHRDGETMSTAGKNPKLVWYSMLPTREQVAAREVELKKLINSNPREIRRMVISFQDLVQELDYS